MKRKIYFVAFAFFSLALLLNSSRLPVLPVKAIGGPPSGYKTLTVEEPMANFPATLDPANCYDSASAELISNLYETLIAFDGERMDVFRQQLATQATVAPPDPTAPPYTLYTVYFQIRQGVNFVDHCRTDYPLTWALYPLTTADVEYSLERVMVHAYQGGPAWMLTEPLLSEYAVNSAMGLIIDQSVERNLTHVWVNVANSARASFAPTSFTSVNMFVGGGFNPSFWTSLAPVLLGTPPSIYDPKVLFQVLAQPWCSILSQQWVLNYVNVNLPVPVGAAFPDWPGTWPGWFDYLGWAPDESPLDRWPANAPTPGMACGTGPYVLDYYDAFIGWSCVNNTGYWCSWPAPGPSPPYQISPPPPQPSSGIKPAGFVSRLTMQTRSTSVRISDMISGACDFADVPRTSAALLHAGPGINSATLKGIRLNYPIPSLKVESMHFTFNITPTPGDTYGTIYPPGVFNQLGIPSDFFTDKNVRLGFANLIDFNWIIANQMLGEAYQPKTCAPNGLQYVNLAQFNYGPGQNWPAATSALMAAWSGVLWATGFTLTLCYDGGNSVGQAVANKLATDVMSLNSLFTVNTMAVPWPSFVIDMKEAKLPLFFARWVPDYFDIQGYMLPYLGYGPGFECGFAYAQRYTAPPAILANLALGLRTAPGGPRTALYNLLEAWYCQDVPSVPLYVPFERGYMRSWVAGHYYNPLSHGIYAYDQWKWNYLRGNVNYDGFVNMADLAAVLNAFGSRAYSGVGSMMMPLPDPRWNFHCDVDGNPFDSSPAGDGGWRDRKIDLYDIIQVLKFFYKTDTKWYDP